MSAIADMGILYSIANGFSLGLFDKVRKMLVSDNAEVEILSFSDFEQESPQRTRLCPVMRMGAVQRSRTKAFSAMNTGIDLPESGRSSPVDSSSIADVQRYHPRRSSSSVQGITLPELSRTVSDISNQSSRADTSESIAAFRIVFDDHIMPGTVAR
ncbi:hypothetical protein KL921_002900 [Ogataea angusta]|uniref:Uncharacterized protein n=1 Tax=Pichia angusta TaxID=870730 RepID=A0ABQ7RSS4_PICAN|nr:hypothetical protein KL921_002900 [Ogataea angusta]KAG7834158.1 hypothetical protein KL943_003454 [Ogataea angusta]KAG7839955.1 hypothetical protein KL942_002754 [Ogataea angusta]KAG7846614.1 hypothetical protein KL940_004212 [Ogataea angusta]KAG7859072.1 hypothetical protein KL919_003137 [Ogataea angusta]